MAVVWPGGHRNDAGLDEGGGCATEVDEDDVWVGFVGHALHGRAPGDVVSTATRTMRQNHDPGRGEDHVGSDGATAPMASADSVHEGLRGELGEAEDLTASAAAVAVGSMASWWRRISSETSRRPELGKVTVCSR